MKSAQNSKRTKHSWSSTGQCSFWCLCFSYIKLNSSDRRGYYLLWGYHLKNLVRCFLDGASYNISTPCGFRQEYFLKVFSQLVAKATRILHKMEFFEYSCQEHPCKLHQLLSCVWDAAYIWDEHNGHIRTMGALEWNEE